MKHHLYGLQSNTTTETLNQDLVSQLQLKHIMSERTMLPWHRPELGPSTPQQCNTHGSQTLLQLQ